VGHNSLCGLNHNFRLGHLEFALLAACFRLQRSGGLGLDCDLTRQKRTAVARQTLLFCQLRRMQPLS